MRVALRGPELAPGDGDLKMAGGWFIKNTITGRRWNRLSASWAIWIWGTDYATREEAEQDAVYLAGKNPRLIGVISVEEAMKWRTSSES